MGHVEMSPSSPAANSISLGLENAGRLFSVLNFATALLVSEEALDGAYTVTDGLLQGGRPRV
jgi:hypothetical protein